MRRLRTEHDAEALAIEALTFLAGDGERLSRFLAITGLDPTSLRLAAAEPGFLAGVLDHILGDEALLLAFAANQQLEPEVISRARAQLDGGGDGGL
jgi:hypothetical protein